MSIDRPANERLQLYERFKRSLSDPSDTEFYDADDLIIIIDQAVDLEDDYVQIEALMRGYRFFPDNEELANRRAFLYFDLNLDSGVSNMLTTNGDDSPMWQLLRLRQKAGKEEASSDDFSKEAQPVLQALLDGNGADKFDDEEMIQFIDCASTCGLYDWLKQNEDALRKKTDYLPTMLYELFVVADMNGDSEYCLKLLEELTEIEPFNIDFWGALAQTQNNCDMINEALASTDYALAIDSENENVLILRASVLIRFERFDEALDIVNSLMPRKQSAMLCELKVRALYGKEDFVTMLVTLNEAINAFPLDESLINIALFVNAPNLVGLLKAHYDAQPEDERGKWHDWARSYYVEGKLVESAAILECLRACNVLNYQGIKMLATSYYCSGHYDSCVTLLEDALADNHRLLIPDVVTAGLLGCLRFDGKRKAKQLFREVMAQFPLSISEDWTISSAMQGVGFTSFMGLLGSMFEKPGKIDVDEIDIFDIPRNYRSDDNNNDE